MNKLLIFLFFSFFISCNSKSDSVSGSRDTVRTMILHESIEQSGFGQLREVLKVRFDTSKYKFTDTIHDGNTKIKTRDSVYLFYGGLDSATSKRENKPITDSAGKILMYEFLIPNHLVIKDANWDIEQLLKERFQKDTTKK